MSNSTTMFCNEICRTCGIQCNCQLADECFSMISLFYEFEMTGRSVSFSYLLQYCTNIEVKDNDRLSKTICDICAEKLKICYEFKVMCEKTNSEIENLFSQSNGRQNGNCNGLKARETFSNGFSDGLERKQNSEIIDETLKKENGFAQISLKCNYCQTSFSSSKDFQNHSPKKCSNSQANNAISDSLSNDYDMASEYAEVKYDSPDNEYTNNEDNYMNMIIVNNDNDNADGGAYDENLTNSTSNHPITAIPFNTVTSNGDFICCLCDKKLNSLTNLRKHAKSHQRLQNFECRRCDLQFMSKNILLLHYRKVHKIVDAQIQKNEPNESFCFICRKKFQKRSSLFKHMQSHQNLPESPYKCSYCLKCFDTFADFELHEKFHELNNHERFKCPFCGLIFPIKTQFNPHFQMHFINDRLYDKWSSSSRKQTASSHSHTSTTTTTTTTTAVDNSESFKCIYCNKIMSNKFNMMNHLKNKHGEDDSMAKFI